VTEPAFHEAKGRSCALLLSSIPDGSGRDFRPETKRAPIDELQCRPGRDASLTGYHLQPCRIRSLDSLL